MRLKSALALTFGSCALGTTAGAETPPEKARGETAQAETAPETARGERARRERARAETALPEAAPPEPALPAVDIARTDAAPTIDGALDDAAWNGAARIVRFVQALPEDNGEPTERTEVYLMYDDEALYIGGKFFYSDPSLVSANILRQKTGLRDDDRFAVVIDPFNQRRGGYRFELNPNGVRVDALYESIDSFETNWDTIWQGTSQLDDGLWTAEMAIPFKSLSFNPNNDSWGMNFGRAVRSKNEEIAWVSRNRTYNPSVVGVVTGFEGMDQGLGLDVVPSVSAVSSKTFDPAARDNELDPSLDLFYRVTPSLNASLTLNTNFAATEVDNRQVNLTRFSLFFPERRDFFLQDNDLFEFGNIGEESNGRSNTAADAPTLENGRPFFSRRLGLSPDGQPVDLKYGGKISGRVGPWTIGTLLVRQDAYEGVPETTAFVGRATMNVLGESSVGLIVTDGDPITAQDNSVYGMDFRYLNTHLPGGRALTGEAWYQQSRTEGVTGEDAAFGVGVSMPNSEGWRGGAALKQIEANFNPALGFVSRSAVRQETMELGYTRFTGGGYIQQVFGGVDAERVEHLSGGLQSERLSWTPIELQSRARDIFKLRYIENKENVTEAFTLYSDSTRTVAVEPGVYSFSRYGFDIETGSQRKVAAEFEYRTGDFYGGERLNLEGELRWRPSKHYFLEASYDWNDIDLPQGDFISRLISLTNGIVFSSSLSWVTLIQHDNISENLGVNSRLHWIPQEGREAFIVLNQNLQDLDKDGRFDSTGSDLTLKFDYTFRF